MLTDQEKRLRYRPSDCYHPIEQTTLSRVGQGWSVVWSTGFIPGGRIFGTGSWACRLCLYRRYLPTGSKPTVGTSPFQNSCHLASRCCIQNVCVPTPGQKKKQEFYLMTCTSFFNRIEHRKLSALPPQYASCKMHRMCDIMTPTNRNL